MIAVPVPSVLRGETDGVAHLSLQPVDEVTLGAVLDEIAGRLPRPERRVRDERGDLRRYVDGESCRRPGGLTTALPDGAEIQVLPSVAGG